MPGEEACVRHIGEIAIAVVLAPVLLAIVLSLGRSIRRAGRMNVDSADYDTTAEIRR
jgi:hypothetical protein